MNKHNALHPGIGHFFYCHGMSSKGPGGSNVMSYRPQSRHTEIHFWMKLKHLQKCEICDCVLIIKHILVDCVGFPTARPQFYSHLYQGLVWQYVGAAVVKFLKRIFVNHWIVFLWMIVNAYNWQSFKKMCTMFRLKVRQIIYWHISADSVYQTRPIIIFDLSFD